MWEGKETDRLTPVFPPAPGSGDRLEEESEEKNLRERLECGRELGCKGHVGLGSSETNQFNGPVTLCRVQVHLHCGVAPGVQDFSGKDFLHGHGCTARSVKCGQLIL